MLRTYRQFILWHPERQRVMPFSNSETPDGIWSHLPESRSWEPEQVKQTYESQGWVVVEAIISVQEDD